MARYKDADCKLCRRAGMKLYLKGIKCETPKCPVEKRPFPPGVHGRARQKKESPYLERLREKQKARRIYGILEKQFRRYFDMAARQKGATGDNLLRILELRLDNVVFRSGLATSRDEARQLVLHRHITVNGKLVNVPSCLCRPGDVVGVKGKSQGDINIQEAIEWSAARTIPAWIAPDHGTYSARVVTAPERAQIDVPVKESYIVEFYSR